MQNNEDNLEADYLVEKLRGDLVGYYRFPNSSRESFKNWVPLGTFRDESIQDARNRLGNIESMSDSPIELRDETLEEYIKRKSNEGDLSIK